MIDRTSGPSLVGWTGPPTPSHRQRPALPTTPAATVAELGVRAGVGPAPRAPSRRTPMVPPASGN